MKKLHDLENKLDINLTSLNTDLEFKEDTKLKKPFRKGDVIKVEIKADFRLRNSKIAVAQNRVVTVINYFKENNTPKVKLIRDKDNIFTAIPV